MIVSDYECIAREIFVKARRSFFYFHGKAMLREDA